MAIKKPAQTPQPPAAHDAGADFIQGAPDAGAYKPVKGYARIRAGRKLQVSFAIPEPLLDAVEQHARAMGQSRAFVFNLAVVEYLRAKGIAPPGV